MRVLITGGSSGLGLETGLYLAERGRAQGIMLTAAFVAFAAAPVGLAAALAAQSKPTLKPADYDQFESIAPPQTPGNLAVLRVLARGDAILQGGAHAAVRISEVARIYSTSGTSGALIKWKETGTGLKWGIVMLGAATGGSPPAGQSRLCRGAGCP